MYRVYFYVPESHLEVVKQAVFSHGAGRLGSYDCCAWQTIGTGQFRALEGSHPAIGKINELMTVNEYKVETVCADECLNNVISALLLSHPYELPAYGFCKMTHSGEIGLL